MCGTFYRIREDTSRELNSETAELQGQETDSARGTPTGRWHSAEGGNG